jgi:hypothetical protein
MPHAVGIHVGEAHTAVGEGERQADASLSACSHVVGDGAPVEGRRREGESGKRRWAPIDRAASTDDAAVG